jgi:PmbA protein
VIKLLNVLDEKIDKALSLLKNKGINSYEVYASSGDIIRAEAEEHEMKNLERATESGISVRILAEGSMGFAYGKDADEELIDSAIKSAKYQFADEYNIIPMPEVEYRRADIFDGDIEKLSAEECLEKAKTVESSALTFDERVRQVRKATFARTLAYVRIVNSAGIDVTGNATYCSASVMVMACSGEEMQSGYDFSISHNLKDIELEKTGLTASKNAVSMLGARHIVTCKMPVLFDNLTTADILETISGSFVGENITKGKSLLKDRLGEVYFSPCITLLDNPLEKNSINSFAFDGEGVASRKNILIEKGRVASFVYDSYWGKVAGQSSTGNSIRGSYRSSPVLSVRHLKLEPGSSMAGVLHGLKQVLKVTDIMGMHTVDPISGEFSVGVNGILIENGIDAYPVRGAAIAGNLFSMLGHVVHVGDDVRSFGSVQTPSILIEEMDISSR